MLNLVIIGLILMAAAYGSDNDLLMACGVTAVLFGFMTMSGGLIINA